MAFVCIYLHKTEFADPMIPMSSNVLIPQLKTPQQQGDTPMVTNQCSSPAPNERY